jgi:hypothetical protein
MLPAVEKPFHLTPVPREIVRGLEVALGGSFIALHDNHARKQHLWLPRGEWRTSRKLRLHIPEHRCHAEAAVNDRWTLAVWAWTVAPLHSSAPSLVKWAAQKLAKHLPCRPVDDLPYPPTGGSGGPSGSAEVGIPVWWARRIRG